MDTLDAISIDVSYALTQLRKYGDIARAIDALERIEENVAAMREAAADDVTA